MLNLPTTSATTNAKMKITLINKSDTTGGAAIFTYRLMKAFRNSGIDAKLLVVEKLTNDPHVVSYSNPIKDKIAFISERLQIFIANKLNRKELFKVDTATFGRNIYKHPLISNADIIILNWINQGALSNKAIKNILELGKPVIWNMHDMWCTTGICHHAYNCTNFETNCGKCIYLNSNNPRDISHQIWNIKKDLYKYPNLHFVSVSNWLADKCKISSLLQEHKIHIIPNTIPIEDYSYKRLPNGDLNLSSDIKILTLGAARIDDPIKGFPLLIEILNHFQECYPEHKDKVHLLLYGNIKQNSLLKQIPIPYTFLGPIDSSKINDILRHTDVLLSTSHYESFGGTLIEGLASGCLPISFNNGGQTDIIIQQKTGYLAKYPNIKDFANGIAWALKTNIQRSDLHDYAMKKFAPNIVVNNYLELVKFITKTKH